MPTEAPVEAFAALRACHGDPPASQAQLASACRALWLATLSLMTAYMQNTAPAHRCLLARRISRNLATLAVQPGVFGAGNCERFRQLAGHWQARADSLADNRQGASRVRGLMHALARLVALQR